MRKAYINQLNRKVVAGMHVLTILGLLLFSENCQAVDAADNYSSIKIFPEHVGVFTADGKQQFVAFGYDALGKATNITRLVSWESSDNQKVTINEIGLASIVTGVTYGQVKITCFYPKRGKAGGAIPLLLLKPSFAVTPSVSAGNGTIDPDSTQSVKKNATTQFALSPADGYHVDSVTGTCGGNLAGNTFTTALITKDCTVDANFAIDILTVTPSKVGNGSITPETPQSINYGNSIDFDVVPDPGHTASVVSDCGGSLLGEKFTAGPILKDCSVDATFTVNTYTLTYETGTCASINGVSPQTVDYGMNGTEVEAVAADGYHFTKWSDESDVNPRTDLVVSADITVTASCEPNE
ncbi:MAG: InlB B-repeat-containing protein [Pseudomonadota bacterium]